MAAKLFDNDHKNRLFNDRYSQRVKQLRVAIPIVIGLVVTFLVLWPILTEETIPDAQNTEANPIDGQQAMLNPVFQGMDMNQRPYIIKAQEVQKLSEKSAALRLKTTDSTLYTSADRSEWLNVRSHFGTYDPNEQSLSLEGHVTLSDWQGLRVITHSVEIGLRDKTAKSLTKVVGYSPQASIRAMGFDVQEGGQILTFQGPATLRLKNNDKHAQSAL